MVADCNRRGYRHLLAAFWDEAALHGLQLPTEKPVSAASFSEARQKIHPDQLKDLLYEIAWARPGDQELGTRRWRGRRVFAVDGCKINLQRDPELEYAFGVPQGAHCPQVLLSVLVDVCARVPMDLEVSGYATSEREHLAKMMASLEPGDILVLDRGYPSHELLQDLDRSSLDFLIRVPATGSFTVIDECRRKGASDQVVDIEPPIRAPAHWARLRVRVVRLQGPNGQASWFLTSLPKSEFSASAIAELYRMRWEAEELFKLLKSSHAGQGQYRSRTAAGVVQEIHALVLLLAISRVCTSIATQHLPESEQASQKGAVLALASFLTRILLETDTIKARTAVDSMLQRITAMREKRRRNRHYPRRSFKPSPRWGPAGRRRT